MVVLAVSTAVTMIVFSQWRLQAFKKLNDGIKELAGESEEFASKTVFDLLRAAPDLAPNIQHVESMFEKPEKGMLLLS